MLFSYVSYLQWKDNEHLMCGWYCNQYYDRCTVLPGAMCKTFQSTSMPLVLNIARASSAIASNPPVASAKIVGPAPERQIPNNPGCVSGVILDVTSGKPGICIAHCIRCEFLTP